MNGVMIVPTGIGCEIGGHAGDATPTAKLLASCCDKLILHPNVVNASDINEMPSNSLYVEGSILDRFLQGKLELREVLQNKILLAVNSPVRSETINAVSAARVTIGADIEIIELKVPLIMTATMGMKVPSGVVHGWEALCNQVKRYSFDVLAIATHIECPTEVALYYFRHGGINPWGRVEAIVSALIATQLNKPVAHAPIMEDTSELKDFNEVVDPRMAAEVISTCYLHCVLKGLHRAPRIGSFQKGLSVRDIDVMISPYGCCGPPHEACLKANIPIIVVRENTCVFNYKPKESCIVVDNYLEAAGVLMTTRAGVTTESVRRPLSQTKVRSKDVHSGRSTI